MAGYLYGTRFKHGTDGGSLPEFPANMFWD